MLVSERDDALALLGLVLRPCDRHSAHGVREVPDDWAVPGLLGDEEGDFVLRGRHEHDAVDELVGVIADEDAGTVAGYVVHSDDFDLREEDGEDGVEENPD